MEESHEQPRPVASPPVLPPTYSLQSIPSPTPPLAKRPGRWLRLRPTMRLLFRRWLYGMTILFRALRPFAGFVVLILALLSALGWMALQLWWPADVAQKDMRVDPLPPSVGVEHYIQGQQTFNADLMWDAFSTDYKAARLRSGATKDTLQTQIETDRQRGVQFLHYDYIGGVKLQEGGSMYFYAVDLNSPNRQGKLPFVFVADNDGKVMGVIAPEY